MAEILQPRQLPVPNMNEIKTFSQLGVGIATLVILYIVVRYFIGALTKKDEQMVKIVEEFQKTINNHIDHEKEQWEKTAEILRELLTAVKNLNGKNKNKRK